ncbi:hypothetical protein T10_12159 [Trichinella papuae]|uniref:Uncharacterized protein n=1 Tax=Trichinella papuae TaxID=268474 RepID=A0A0V1LXN3_9BILA|nr:hypothetical protein T10_12159 [Trichinella papuae]
MKQFVKALDKNRTCFQYLYTHTMTQVEEEAWVAFTNVVSGFLGKRRTQNMDD